MSNNLSAGWKKLPLSEVVDVASGQIDPREQPYSDMLHVGGDNIESHTGMLFGMQTAGQLGRISGKYLFDERDILYSKIRPYLNKVATPDFKGVCSADIYPLRPKKGVATREFLARILRSRDFLDFAETCSSRTSIPKINRPSLLRYECGIPPLPEQKRIAAILDKADAIRRKRQESLRLTEQLLRSAFLEMFGDPVTNPRGWEVKKLGECLDFITSGSRGWAKYYSDEGAKFLRIQNVGRNQLLVDDLAFVAAPDGAEANRTSVQEGDVVLSITADLGRTAVIPRGFGKGHINQHLCLIRLREGNPTFVSEYLASSGGQVQIKRADRVGVKSGLNFDDVRGLDVLFPPRDLQDRFATIHSNIRGHIQLALAGGSKLGDLSSSLAARAFSGRL